MSNCKDCSNWVLERRRRYSDGTEITLFEAPSGKGFCDILRMETEPDFGCNKFKSAFPWGGVSIENVEGAPWEHFKMGPCPDCNGTGGGESACHRCAGIAKVRFYDDGYIGEEQTRRHPKEPPPNETELQEKIIKERADILGVAS